VIHAPGNLPVRPTTDFAKTALFNILNNQFSFDELAVLDLFCGTGNITYEFASRGCEKIVTVDVHAACVKFVKETCAKFSLSGIQTIKADVFKFLESCNQKFDIIFADPPYEMDNIERVAVLVFGKQLLNDNGWLIIEHQAKRTLQVASIPYELRVYSNCAFSIFKNHSTN
jgi:16S rRNA (guanine(966)-N(2))-methyltransferase RsmD